MSKVLSLDLSSKSTGYCIAENEKLIEYDCITPKSTNVITRILATQQLIMALLEKYKPDEIIAEEVRVDYQNAHTYKVLTWLQAAVVFAVYNYNNKLEIKFYQPSEWRSKIGIKTGAGIKRAELKAADIQWVKNKYDIEVNDDIADAICLYNAHINAEKETPEVKKFA